MKDAPIVADAVPDSALLENGPTGRATHRLELSALAALFWLTLRQHVRGRRLVVLACLYLLPVCLVILVRSVESHYQAAEAEIEILLMLIPHTLVPLTALLYATGMIHDEIEEQTLTYLLVRPLPKWGIFLTKLLATMLLTMVIAALFTMLTYVAVYWGEPTLWGAIVPRRALQVSGITCLALFAYCSVFGCLSFLTRWPLVVGIGYIALFEGLLANIDFAIRRLTINYYFRVLVQEWVGTSVPQWRLNPLDVPAPRTCVLILLGAGLVATLVAMILFTTREFRVKTPEGS
jgi:ABC-2 type transport system permease protein